MNTRARSSSSMLLALALSGIGGFAMAQQQPRVELLDQPCPAESTLRVAVFSDGRIELNGVPTPLEKLAVAIETAARGAKEVCLHRQNPQAAEPHPNMLTVIDALVKLRLPIAFFWDAQFQKRVAFKP